VIWILKMGSDWADTLTVILGIAWIVFCLSAAVGMGILDEIRDNWEENPSKVALYALVTFLIPFLMWITL
jgi:hypothetical protein